MKTAVRPPVNIRFRFNTESGQIEDFIVDDNAIAADESYHDRVAARIAGLLSKNPEIFASGPRQRAETLLRRQRERAAAARTVTEQVRQP